MHESLVTRGRPSTTRGAWVIAVGALLAAGCPSKESAHLDDPMAPGDASRPPAATGPTPGSTGDPSATPPTVSTKVSPVLPGMGALPPAFASSDSAACQDVKRRFRARRLAATGSCKTAADCGCFAGVDPAVPCGSITDKKTSDDLGKLLSEFFTDTCSYGHNCAPWSCEPACDHGTCVNDPQHLLRGAP